MENKILQTDNKKNTPQKDKLFLFSSILMLIYSIAIIAITAIIMIILIIDIIVDLGFFDITTVSLFSGISFVFGAALAAVAFYAALHGIWQHSLIKCRKLGIVLLLLNSVSYTANIFCAFLMNHNTENLVLQCLLYTILSFTLPGLYLLGANLALKKNKPKSKYKKVIKSI